VFLLTATALPTALPAVDTAPRATASARITVVVPSREVRREIARHCRDRPATGYVPVVRLAAPAPRVDGRFVRCEAGGAIYLAPGGE